MTNNEKYTALYHQSLEAHRAIVALCSDYERLDTQGIVDRLVAIQSTLNQSASTAGDLLSSDLTQP